ncbi:hypothetical protein TNCV_3571761 [Trichonephila clavipes]|nr:hypothetical protein TNCV_3571761 [Trichonephila clavipes]
MMYDSHYGDFFLMAPNDTTSVPHWWDSAEPLWITAEKKGLRSALYWWDGCQKKLLYYAYLFIYLSNARDLLLDHLTLSLLVPADHVISQIFSESSGLEQVVAIHSGMSVEWAGLVSSHAKPLEVYSPKVMFCSLAKVGNSLDSLQVHRDWAHGDQSFPYLPKTFRFLGHDSIFVIARGADFLCSSEG